MRQLKEETDIQTITAAKLRSQGFLQRAIADRLGISQPEVSRLLVRAQNQGWLQFPDPVFNLPDAARDLWEKAETRYFACPDVHRFLNTLYKEDESPLRKVTLIHSNPDETFRPSVVDVIRERLSQVSIVGVTWGRTINRLVATLRTHILVPPPRQGQIQFVPLCGEPLKDRGDPVKYSSSALAGQLNEIFNGRDRGTIPPSLAGLPAFIPVQFDRKGRKEGETDEVETIQRFFRMIAGYADVFGDGDEATPETRQEKPLAEKMEAILTSVGVTKGTHRGIFLKERVELGDITEDDLEKWVVGDLGGVIIARDGLENPTRLEIDRINARWTGVRLRHFKDCADRARTNSKPGVIVLALGSHRSEMVKQCVRLGLINELLIDQEMARALTMTGRE